MGIRQNHSHSRAEMLQRKLLRMKEATPWSVLVFRGNRLLRPKSNWASIGERLQPRSPVWPYGPHELPHPILVLGVRAAVVSSACSHHFRCWLPPIAAEGTAYPTFQTVATNPTFQRKPDLKPRLGQIWLWTGMVFSHYQGCLLWEKKKTPALEREGSPMSFGHCYATSQVKANCSGRSTSSGASAQPCGSAIFSAPSKSALSSYLPSASLLTQTSTLGFPEHQSTGGKGARD